ncbi:MAG: hypothetical protein ACWA40_10285 [Planktomarina sp.]
MSTFSTQFPVTKELTRAEFILQAVDWLKGIQKSDIINNDSIKEIDDQNATLLGENDESVSFKLASRSNWQATGVRHELPDRNDRIWRSEIVHTRSNGNISWIRVRCQCMIKQAGVEALTPHRPHLLRQLIDAGFGSVDGQMEVRSIPHELQMLSKDVDFAATLISGDVNSTLPILYISKNSADKYDVDVYRIASRLAGVAHVVIEPSRQFSFELMSKCGRRNPYGGAVGLFSHQVGELYRFRSNSMSSIYDAIIKQTETAVSSRKFNSGCDWAELQEQQTHELREKLKEHSTDSLDKYIVAFDEEMKGKDEEILRLKAELDRIASTPIVPKEQSVFLRSEVFVNIGDELYNGEFSDRIRHYLAHTIDNESSGVDDRTRETVKRFLSATEFSGGAIPLKEQIKSAGKDVSRMSRDIGILLRSFGFEEKSDGKHRKFYPPDSLFGIKQETLPKTPSDARAGKNKAGDIIKNFGLNKFCK